MEFLMFINNTLTASKTIPLQCIQMALYIVYRLSQHLNHHRFQDFQLLLITFSLRICRICSINSKIELRKILEFLKNSNIKGFNKSNHTKKVGETLTINHHLSLLMSYFTLIIKAKLNQA